MLWHGQQFGKKGFESLIPLTIFKGHLNMASTFFGNMFNGYSGLPNYDYFYYSLVAVLNTDLLPVNLMLIDQPVAYNFK